MEITTVSFERIKNVMDKAVKLVQDADRILQTTGFPLQFNTITITEDTALGTTPGNYILIPIREEDEAT